MFKSVGIEEIKLGIAALPTEGQNELSAFLFHLRQAADRDYQTRIEARLSDKDPTHWITPEEFERQLGQK